MFRRTFVTVAALIFLAIGAFAQSQSLTMQVAGVSRHYILYAPSGLTGNPPLLYVIHGFNMTAQQMVSITRMNSLADTAKIIVAYPDALPDTANQPSWDMRGQNDFNFILAIIDSAAGRYHIDRNRVYASGFSQGGFMSFQLGCRYADKFAAIAPVSGLLTGACNATRAVPMFLTFGTADVATPDNFMKSVDAWTKMLACPADPVITRPYPAGKTNSVVTRIDYPSCKNGSEVMADSIQGGPHEWPMNTTTKVNNSIEVWNFVKKFSLQGGSGIGAKTVPAERGVSVTYSEGFIRLKGMDGNASARILDERGRLVARIPAGQAQLEFKDKAKGVYQVQVDGNGSAFAIRIFIP